MEIVTSDGKRFFDVSRMTYASINKVSVEAQ